MNVPVAPEKAFIESSASPKILLSEKQDVPSLREILKSPLPIASSARPIVVALAIGPEGGWTDSEIASARAAGFIEASLGENILRTETAVLASMAILGFALAG
jgi:16S rRNA (uracil1498-N3)-methyltransferase